MTEEKNKDNQGSCCHTGGCCGIKKCIVKLLLALLLFGFGFYLGKSNVCPWQMCPISQQK